ncbi:MAG: ribosome maturation factor RimM, partial [Sphingomicrobium sp.]
MTQLDGVLIDTDVLVIGGGIAGAALAMFLERAGITPVIYEGRPGPADDTGAFLNLAPNGLAVLETLGIAGEIAARGTPTTRIEFLNHRGKRLGVFPETTILIRRDELNRGLREAAVARGIRFEYGKRLVEVRMPGEGGAIARFAEVVDRTAAEALRSTALTVPRSALPALDDGEYYHADLIGLAAVNAANEPLGRVTAIHNFGAGDIIEIAPPQGPTMLLPFTNAVVPTVD